MMAATYKIQILGKTAIGGALNAKALICGLVYVLSLSGSIIAETPRPWGPGCDANLLKREFALETSLNIFRLQHRKLFEDLIRGVSGR
jgi:hypothetical protein